MKKLLNILLIMLLIFAVPDCFYGKLVLEYPENDSYINSTMVELRWSIDGDVPPELIGYKVYVENNGATVKVENSVDNKLFINDLKMGEAYSWNVKCVFRSGFAAESTRVGAVKHGVTKLNFRPEPNTKCNPYYSIDGGTTFQVIEIKSKWLKVKLDKSGDTGWLSGDYVETTMSTPYACEPSKFYTGGQPTEKTELQQITLVSGPTDLSKIPDSDSKTLKFKEDYTLWAVVKVKDSAGRSVSYLGFSDDGKTYPDAVRIGRSTVNVKRWNREVLGNIKFEWGKLFARLEHKNFKSVSDMDSEYRSKHGDYPWYTNVIPNGASEGQWRSEHFKKMKWSCDQMEYYEMPYFKPSFFEKVKVMLGGRDSNPQWSCQAICLAKGGTVRYNVKAVKSSSDGSQEMMNSNGYFSKPFNDSAVLNSNDYHGGIKTSVHRISYLGNSDNPLINGLFAYSAVPWLYGSGEIGGGHQTERFVGYDCADLVMGAYQLNVDPSFKIKYGANFLAKSLSKTKGYGYLDFVMKGALYSVKGQSDPERAYTDCIVDADGKQVVINVGENEGEIKPGDLIFFDWNRDGKMDHTTVFYKDGKQAPGILSPDDLILMAGHEGLHIVTLSREIKYDLPTRFFLRKFSKL